MKVIMEEKPIETSEQRTILDNPFTLHACRGTHEAKTHKSVLQFGQGVIFLVSQHSFCRNIYNIKAALQQ